MFTKYMSRFASGL